MAKREQGPEQHGAGRERDDPGARAEWWLASRRDEQGDVLHGAFAKAVARRRTLQRELHARARDDGGEPGGTPGGPGSVNWTPIGPSVVAAGSGQNIGVSGRVTALAVGPGGARVYAGAANGGVWLSLDGGASWQPLEDYAVSPSLFGGSVEADSLSIGALGVRFGASAATDEVYVGTGEPTGNYDAYLGVGIRHSASGGAPGTWSLEATNLTGRGVYAIVIDPDDPTVVLAATSAGLFRRPAAAPFTAWTQVSSAAFTNASLTASALVVAGSGASKRYYAAFYGDRVYESRDALTWTALSGLAGTGRIALGVAESDPSIAYAFRADGTLARLVGASFQAVTGLPAAAVFPGEQGWYDIAILVDPTDPDTIFLGGDQAPVFKGTVSSVAGGGFSFPFNAANTGNPWADPTFVGQGVHSDVHTLAFALDAAGSAHDGTSVWVGCDGGVFHSSASGTASSFRARNTGLAITETAYLAQRPDTDAVVFAGTQDNGTNRLLGEEASLEVIGGDGGGVAVDQNDPYRVMRQYVRASLDRSVSGGGGGWSGVVFPPRTANTPAQDEAAATESGRTGFVAPIASSPAGVNPALVAFGTYRLWLSEDWGTSWVTLPSATNPYTPATPDAAQDSIDGTAIGAIAFASGTRVYAATPSTIWRYDKAATWSRTALPSVGLPAFYLFTALAVDAAGGLYATLGGGGVAHLYYFDGTSWQAALPTSVVDVPAHAVAVDPDNQSIVYVGTDVGCWKGTKTGAASWSWTLFSQGLPEAAIVDLAVHERTRLLRASTHGRGVWEIQMDAAGGLDPDLYLRVNYADTGRTPGGARFPWLEGAPDPTRQGARVYHWMSADVKVRRPSFGGLPALSSPPDYLDYAVNIGDYVDSTSNVETADSSGPNRIFVEIHNRGLTPVPAAQVRVCLLVTDASAGLPALPAGYAGHINAGDTSAAWLAGSGWHFADPSQPYRTPPRDLDVRTPQVVEFTVDFASLSLPLGHDHVCAAAFLTATSDTIAAVDQSLDLVTMHDKHVAHRNLHLVAAGATPSTEGGGYQQQPQTFLVWFHNAERERAEAELIFDCSGFPGLLSLLLPRQVLGRVKPKGFAFGKRGGAICVSECARGAQRTSQVLASLEHHRPLVLERPGSVSVLGGLVIDPDEPIAAALTIQAPSESSPGERFHFDVIQRRGSQIVGGSSYVVAVAAPRSGT
jgi:hypothetical protein